MLSRRCLLLCDTCVAFVRTRVGSCRTRFDAIALPPKCTLVQRRCYTTPSTPSSSHAIASTNLRVPPTPCVVSLRTTTTTAADEDDDAERAARREEFYERWVEFRRREDRADRWDTVFWSLGLLIGMLGATWAMVPLYRKFCAATGAGGQTAKKVQDEEMAKIGQMNKIENRVLRIRFLSDVGSNLTWHFRPQQSTILVHPGETALAFYTAYNPTDKPVIGISTYNIIPFQAAAYFMKIQCFCFEEQILNPGEQVDMPVFFYIDPDFVDDPATEWCEDITLNYTFFESKAGMTLTNPLSQLHASHVAP